MPGRFAMLLALTVAPFWAQPQPAPADLLDRFRASIRETLRQLPDYTCQETIQRSRRPVKGSGFQNLDTLRLQVALINRRERYSWADATQFEDRELRELIGKGVISTGGFASHVAHVFLSRAAQFQRKGQEEMQGRPAVRFDYEVPVEHSTFKVSVPPEETEVGVRGTFWVDVETLDLLRLEVHADEVPTELGISEVRETIDYARTPIGDGTFLLPVSSTLLVTDLQSEEHRNQASFSACRQYKVESNVRFAGEETSPEKPAPSVAPTAISRDLPPRLLLEIELEQDITPEKSALGDSIRAVVSKAARVADQIVVPVGSVVHGRLVRLEKEARPFLHYIVGLELHTLQLGDSRVELFATLQDAGPAAGLLRQTRRMDPVFTRKRTTRFDILVREKPKGEGVLHWDARHPRIRKGLKMRWVTTE